MEVIGQDLILLQNSIFFLVSLPEQKYSALSSRWFCGRISHSSLERLIWNKTFDAGINEGRPISRLMNLAKLSVWPM